MSQKNLANIIDLEKWQALQDAMAKTTRFAIILVDYRGQPVTKHSHIHPFCAGVRADDNLRPFCEKCDARGGIEATRLEQPYIYRCHFDILDMAVPIIFDGHYVGALLAGQIRLAQGQEDLEQVLTIPDTVKNVTLARFEQAYAQLPEFSLAQTQDVADLLLQTSRYIIGEALQKEYLVQVKGEGLSVAARPELGAREMTRLASELNHAAQNFLFTDSAVTYVARNSRLQPAFDEIYEQKHERLLLPELAEMCHLSLSHFSKSFKEETGENFTTFYRNLKVFWAKERLLQTDLSIADIASELGFEDASYFIRLFHQVTGYAPLAYKKFVGQKTSAPTNPMDHEIKI